MGVSLTYQNKTPPWAYLMMCAIGRGRGWLMPASSLMMEIVARQSWFGVQSTMGEEWAGRGGWSLEPASVHPDPEESNVAMGDGVFGRNFVYVQDDAPPHTCDTAAFLEQQYVEVMDWPAWSSIHEPNGACLGSNVSLDPRHGWPPLPP